MTLLILTYLAGALTILTPCILPILPFVFTRADQPFVRGGLPMMLAMAGAFAVVASLAAVVGHWAVEANRYGRDAALLLMAGFGVTLLFPGISTRLTAPLVAVGAWLTAWTQGRRSTILTSAALGVATGFLWAPCAGPVLGLILSGAALNGPSVETTVLLLTYGLGAATSLSAGLLVGRRILGWSRLPLRWTESARRAAGAAVISGAAVIGLGLDASLLTRLSTERTYRLEGALLSAFDHPLSALATPAQASTQDALPGPLAALLNRPGWVNSQPLRSEDLRGKVVLVNFWTYSCINCLRALPHIRTWAEAYKDQGLVVVGVHAPEFAFERDAAAVAKAASSLGVRHPVVLDNEFHIWRAFRNVGWPGFFIVAADGSIQHQAFGEGHYDKAERVIQRLLAESAGATSRRTVEPAGQTGAQTEADWVNLASPETYLGYEKAARFSSPDPVVRDVPGEYHHGSMPRLNEWSLSGTWAIGAEYATSGAAGGSVRYRFHARDLHLVLRPGSPDRAVRFRITIDGVRPGASHGSDVDEEGFGVVREGRLYQLVRQAGLVADRTFEIEFFDPGIRAYAFTFG